MNSLMQVIEMLKAFYAKKEGDYKAYFKHWNRAVNAAKVSEFPNVYKNLLREMIVESVRTHHYARALNFYDLLLDVSGGLKKDDPRVSRAQ